MPVAADRRSLQQHCPALRSEEMYRDLPCPFGDTPHAPPGVSLHGVPCQLHTTILAIAHTHSLK